MPKESTHLYLAAMASDIIAESLPATASVLNSAPNLFMLGSVSPDSIFNYTSGGAKEFFKRHIDYSHNPRSHNLFGFLQRFADAELPLIPALSFGLGTICHLSADAVFHPMIHHFTGQNLPGRKDATVRHYRFESALDKTLRRLFPELRSIHLSPHLKAMELPPNLFASALEAIHVPPEEAGIAPAAEYLSMYRQHAKHERYYGGFFYYTLTRLINVLLAGSREELPALFYRDSGGRLTEKQLLRERSAFFNIAVSYLNPVTGNAHEKSFAQMQDEFTSLFTDYLRPVEQCLTRGSADPAWDDLSPAFEAMIPKDPNTGLAAAYRCETDNENHMSFFSLKTFEEVFSSKL